MPNSKPPGKSTPRRPDSLPNSSRSGSSRSPGRLRSSFRSFPKTAVKPLVVAHDTPPEKRTPEQKQLLRDHPNLNVTEATFQQLNRDASKELRVHLDHYEAVKATRPKEDFLRALTEASGVLPGTFVFARGEPTQPRQAVLPGELTVLDPQGEAVIPVKDPALTTSGRRLAYARWLTSGKHPLTPRVLVNRVWMHHFGRGIVATPGDFGAARRAAHASRVARLAGERFRRRFLAAETGASADHDLHRLSPVGAAQPRAGASRPREPPARPDVGPPPRGRAAARRDPGSQWRAQPEDVRSPRAGPRE